MCVTDQTPTLRVPGSDYTRLIKALIAWYFKKAFSFKTSLSFGFDQLFEAFLDLALALNISWYLDFSPRWFYSSYKSDLSSLARPLNYFRYYLCHPCAHETRKWLYNIIDSRGREAPIHDKYIPLEWTITKTVTSSNKLYGNEFHHKVAWYLKKALTVLKAMRINWIWLARLEALENDFILSSYG